MIFHMYFLFLYYKNFFITNVKKEIIILENFAIIINLNKN